MRQQAGDRFVLAGEVVERRKYIVGQPVEHTANRAALEPKAWKITGSVIPILAATSDTFPVNAERPFHPERLLLTFSAAR